jgi:hypothetical protein
MRNRIHNILLEVIELEGQSNINEDIQMWDNLPENVYVHGRALRQDLETNNVLFVSKSWNVAEQYAGSNGSIWLITLLPETSILDANDESQCISVIEALIEDYKDDILSPDLDYLFRQNSRDALIDDLNPEDIVERGGLYDIRDFCYWIYERFAYDFVKTNNGGVVFNREGVQVKKIIMPDEQ